jgi:hypothetical protein
MITCLFIFVTLSYCNFINGQSSANQIEVNPSVIWDSYPAFKIRFNSVTNSTIKLQGISWGAGANYKHFLKTRSFIKMGLGYYKYSFNKIESNTPPFGTSKSRVINYTGSFNNLLYATNKYWYNTFTATIGFERQFDFKKNTKFITCVDIVNYYTFSQRYNVPAANVNNRKANGRYFGFSFIVNTGLQKDFGKFKIGPNLNLPIFRLWKQDAVFPGDQNSDSRSKWLNGVGIGLTCAYSLK